MATRRKQRFSRLEQQFRDSGGTAEAGSKLAGYIDFKKGVNKVNIRESRKLTAEQRIRYGVAILPFGLSLAAAPTAADRYVVPVTKYSWDKLITVGLTKNKLGIADREAANQKEDIFFPALVRIFVSIGTELSPISGVTKKEYKRKDGYTVSYPFGRTMTDVLDVKNNVTETQLDDADYEDVKTALVTFLRNKPVTGGVIKSLSFEPEVWKASKKDLAAPPA